MKTIKVKLVADTNDSVTKQLLKTIWDGATKEQREGMLKTATYSSKYATMPFESLTPAIQSIIITFQANVTLDNGDTIKILMN